MVQYWWIFALLLVGVLGLGYGLTRRRSRSDVTALEAYVEGLRAIIAGDQKTAFVKFKQAVDLDTDNIDAYLKLGDLFRGTGLVDKALQIHRELTLRQQIPSQLRAEVKRSLAEDYIAAKSNGKAIELLEKMIKAGENQTWSEDRLLELYIRERMWQRAEELQRSIMKGRSQKTSPVMSGIKVMIGRDLQDQNQFHKARLQYKEAVSLNEKDPFPYLYIAESYLREERINDGLEYLKKLCDNIPQQSYLGFPMLEETLFNLGRFSEVEDIYRGVLDKDRGNIHATVALAGILEKKGEIREAENLLRTILDSGRSNEAAALKLARLLADSGRVDDGLAILSELAEKTDTYFERFVCRKCGKSLQIPTPYCRECGNLGTYI